MRLLRGQPLYDRDATRACLEAHGFLTHPADGEHPALGVRDADGEMTFLLFFANAKAAKAHALPQFAHMPSGIGPEVHGNVVVSNLAGSKDGVVDCLRPRG